MGAYATTVALDQRQLKALPVVERCNLVAALCDEWEAGLISRAEQVHEMERLYATSTITPSRKKELTGNLGKFFSDLQYRTPLAFARDNWAFWSPEYKLDFLTKFHDLQAKWFGFKPTKVVSAQIEGLAHFNELSYQTTIDTDQLGVTKRDACNAIEYLFHEGVHARQMADTFKVMTEDNMLIQVQHYKNAYISPRESFSGYKSNPVEQEAREITASFKSIYTGTVAWLS